MKNVQGAEVLTGFEAMRALYCKTHLALKDQGPKTRSDLHLYP